MEHIQVLKDLLEVMTDSDNDDKPDLLPKEVYAIQWAVRQLDTNKSKTNQVRVANSHMRKLKRWWQGTSFNIGDTVYWENKIHPEFTGEYSVTSKCDKNGLVGIYNDKMKHRKIHTFELTLVEK